MRSMRCPGFPTKHYRNIKANTVRYQGSLLLQMPWRAITLARDTRDQNLKILFSLLSFIWGAWEVRRILCQNTSKCKDTKWWRKVPKYSRLVYYRVTLEGATDFRILRIYSYLNNFIKESCKVDEHLFYRICHEHIFSLNTLLGSCSILNKK